VDAQNGEIVDTVNQIERLETSALSTPTYFYGNQTIMADAFMGNYRLRETGRPINTLNMLNTANPANAIDFTNKNNKWTHDASVINGVIKKKVNTNWKTAAGDEDVGNRPDIYIEINNANGELIFSSQSSIQFDVPAASFRRGIVIVIDNITLLDKSPYTLKVFDNDVGSPPDVLGTFKFDNVFGTSTVNLSDGGTIVQINGIRGISGALDGHWGMERVYDYYANPLLFNRKSYDGKNHLINSYVHANKSLWHGDPNNAAWALGFDFMVYGDGDGIARGPMTALDVLGHEFTHGVVSWNGRGGLNTNIAAESSALDESFGDIFGCAVEQSVPGIGHNWTIGEKTFKPDGPLAGHVIRSLENPKAANARTMGPDTYMGANWDASLVDFHTNAGVQNKWFYLLANGGTNHIDENPTNPTYHVPPIGIDKAVRIAYKNMMEILMPTATYNDAYRGSLRSVSELGFANPTNEFRAVREAWFAVGVAKKPVITSFDPTHGPIGTTVTIKGTDFTGISHVGFNGTLVDPSMFTVNSDATQITVNVPVGATTGEITIEAGYQTVKSTNKFTVDCLTPLDVTVASSDATSFTVDVTGGTPPYSYSLDNINFQTSSEFSGLTSGKTYTIYVKDAGSCKGQTTFLLSNPINCNVLYGSGGQGTTFITQNLGTTPGRVEVDYEMFTIPDQMDIFYNGVQVASTGDLVSGPGALFFNYNPTAVGPFYCIIRMYAPNQGTAWQFTALCPVSVNNVINNLAAKNNAVDMSVEDKLRGNKFQAIIYPNPASTIADLKINGVKGKALIVLSDISGRELWRTTRVKDAEIMIPVEHLLLGTYLVTVINNNGEQRKTLKLVKTK
jgi:hypothetical protein